MDPIRHDVERGEQNADLPLTVLDLDVVPGDLIHADRHGAVVIRPEYVDALPDAIDQVMRRESPILEAARRDDFSVEKLLFRVEHIERGARADGGLLLDTSERDPVGPPLLRKARASDRLPRPDPRRARASW